MPLATRAAGGWAGIFEGIFEHLFFRWKRCGPGLFVHLALRGEQTISAIRDPRAGLVDWVEVSLSISYSVGRGVDQVSLCISRCEMSRPYQLSGTRVRVWLIGWRSRRHQARPKPRLGSLCVVSERARARNALWYWSTPTSKSQEFGRNSVGTRRPSASRSAFVPPQPRSAASSVSAESDSVTEAGRYFSDQ